MTLEDLIDALGSADPEQRVAVGFHKPQSYRGYYSELAFEPVADVTVASMLAAAQEALGSTYQGYKGGDYTMHAYVDVYLAHHGETGEQVGPVLLSYMFGSPVVPERRR